MSTNKVEMSLDDIIKANKNKDKSNRSNCKARKGGNNRFQRKSLGPKTGRGIQKRNNRNISNAPQKNRNKIQNKPNTRNVRVNKYKQNRDKATTVATKKLVQRLVKKALAQRNIRGSRNVRKSNIQKRGGVRLIRTPVVLNRINTNSRMIARRRNVAKVAPARRQIKYNVSPVQYVATTPLAVQRNFVPRQKKIQTRPIIIQQGPTRQRNQRSRAPVFQLVPVQNRGNSVRSQINALRRQNVYRPRVQRPQRQFRQNVPQRQQRRRFQNKQRNGRQPREVFFEPQNFLQRIPVDNRRF